MKKRNILAQRAQDGACNPIPLVLAFRNSIEEIKQENPNWDTNTILDDPAMRLIVHQLAYIFRCGELDELSTGEYSRCMEVISHGAN